MVAFAPMLAPASTTVGTISRITGAISSEQLTISVNGRRIEIIREANVWSDERPILDRYTCWNEGERFDFDGPTDDDATLDLDECGDLRSVTDGAAVQIDEVRVKDDHVLAQRYVWKRSARPDLLEVSPPEQGFIPCSGGYQRERDSSKQKHTFEPSGSPGDLVQVCCIRMLK